jgi:tetratricopeptide (TPR) repeat protein
MRRICFAGLLILAINGAYLFSFSQATLFYEANVLLHLALGVALTVVAFFALRRYPVAAGTFIAAALPALFLVFKGNTLDHRGILWVHIGLALVALVAIAFSLSEFRPAYAAAMGVMILLPALALAYGKFRPNPNDRIQNPAVAPLSMDVEGAGASSPFAPSSAQTNTAKIIPSNFFMDSEMCGGCHKDAYEQWKGSMHHFASFNNQFYRKAIEHMQDVVGTRPSKWCAGCHDHAVFFNGRFDRPIREQVETPEAQNGLGCMSCHSIARVGGSMGNADFTVEYPPLHELASSHNRYIRAMDRFLIYLNPKPHRAVFLKPFMREQSAEFCSTCHKVHLDIPVNNYRWFRGFNDYDNWQASGVSGQGARSFYYPAKSQVCVDCHMPLLASQDPGNRDGKVHSHRFPGANTAVPYANQDDAQMSATEKFLKSGFITVDIFAISPVEKQASGTPMVRRTEVPQANSTFAIGEEAEHQGPALIRDIGKIAAPLGATPTALEPGTDVRVDVVVRTRKIGHFFPAGTVDTYDTWLELQAKDADGNVIFWSGNVADGGKGPVETGAHFYRSYQLDAEGNPINKRNAWQSRSLLYVRLIPPGAADVAHYRVHVPKTARGPIQFTANLNYRKFAWYYTQFSYGARQKPGQDPALRDRDHDSSEYEFGPQFIPASVSGTIRDRIPDLPIMTLASAKASLPLGPPRWSVTVHQADRERWNDWGIGLLLQGDLKGAEYAFKKVTEAEPAYADGWVNVARALIQEGETDAAKPFVAQAIKVAPQLDRIKFFLAAIQKTDGDYDGALQSLERVRTAYPRDRVVLNQIARLQFLKRDYAKAIETLKQVNSIDPEDVQMHYTWMLSSRGLGDAASAEREEKLFRRFKADEASQSITATRRAISPEDNNERQPIHDHESAVK